MMEGLLPVLHVRALGVDGIAAFVVSLLLLEGVGIDVVSG
jgi:hypothetical protein